jgi:hypothetical protein
MNGNGYDDHDSINNDNTFYNNEFDQNFAYSGVGIG